MAPVPVLRPFRALRYGMPPGSDLSAVICPPYDVIGPDLRTKLAARDPHNAVHLELPEVAPGAPAGERYREAARTLVTWRNEGVLRKDRIPSIYPVELRFTVPGTGIRRVQRGFQARLRLEPLEGGDVLPHERTLSAPKEDRYQLLRATGANLSPVVALFDGQGETAELLGALCDGAPAASASDEDGSEHVVWQLEQPTGGWSGAMARLLERAGAGPAVIADGHHRYETALRYREERGAHRACESDPAYDYVLAALFDLRDPALTVLPTHRTVRDVPNPPAVIDRLAAWFDLREETDAQALIVRFGPLGDESLGPSDIGLVTSGRGTVLRSREGAAEDLLGDQAGPLRGVGSALLGSALERVLGLGAGELASGDRVTYSKDATAAAATGGEAAMAFLLQPTPPSVVAAVARAGAVMPQKSTFFHPKVATGMLFNPLES